jgi:hypothetical protein
MTTLLSVPYLIILIQRNFQFDGIPADLILQILNGLLLTRLYSFYQQSNNPLPPEQDRALTLDHKNITYQNTPLLDLILNLFKEDLHRK